MYPNRSTRSVALLTIGLLTAPGIALATTYSISWYTIDGGGGASANGAYAIQGTIGQPDAQMPPVMSGGIYSLTGGYWAQSASCTLLGDLNQDGHVDGQDVQLFVNCLLGINGANCSCADFDGNGVGQSDVALFVQALLGP